MALRVTFDLEDEDLAYFRDSLDKARALTEARSETDILRNADERIMAVHRTKMPKFVADRVAKLGALIEMMRDTEWALPPTERGNVLVALAYLAEAEDLIPDEVPVLGYVDDAIMIELAVKELQPEIEAFVDFCRYRANERARQRNDNLSRDEYLAIKRRELHDRMRRRRAARRQRLEGGSRPRFRLFT